MAKDLWLPARELSEQLGCSNQWLYAWSRCCDGPIRRKWGTVEYKKKGTWSVILFNATDAQAWWALRGEGANKKKRLYPGSIPERSEKLTAEAQAAPGAAAEPELVAMLRKLVEVINQEPELRKRLRSVTKGVQSKKEQMADVVPITNGRRKAAAGRR